MPKKFVKAYCASKNRHFGLDVEEFGGQYEVTNFIDISASEAAVLPTQVKNQDTFRVHSNLQACWGDGSRVVGSSSWPCGRGNCANGKYNYQCLFCSNLKIDKTKAGTGGQLRKGDVIHLSQGQEVAIEDEDGEALKHVLVGAGWDEERGGHMDVDCSVLLVGSDTELIYFGHKESDYSCVSHHGDNLTGRDSDTSGQDDENIDVYLDRVPSKFNRLIFFYNIYSGQKLSSLRNMYFRIADPDSGSTLVDYRLHQGSSYDSAVVVAVLKREGSGWSLKAIDENAGCENVHQLASSLPRRY